MEERRAWSGSRSQSQSVAVKSLLIQDRHGMRTPLTGAFPPALPACLPPAPPSTSCLSVCLRVRLPCVSLAPPALPSTHLAAQPTLLGRPSWNKTRSWPGLWVSGHGYGYCWGWSGLVPWGVCTQRCCAMRYDATGRDDPHLKPNSACISHHCTHHLHLDLAPER